MSFAPFKSLFAFPMLQTFHYFARFLKHLQVYEVLNDTSHIFEKNYLKSCLVDENFCRIEIVLP